MKCFRNFYSIGLSVSRFGGDAHTRGRVCHNSPLCNCDHQFITLADCFLQVPAARTYMSRVASRGTAQDTEQRTRVTTVDLRSDTVTKPTPEMRRAMAEAEVGDDAYLASKGADTVNLDAFRTLPSSQATGSNKTFGRLTNLTTAN